MDLTLRELERLAKAGDQDAARKMHAKLCGSGLHLEVSVVFRYDDAVGCKAWTVCKACKRDISWRHVTTAEGLAFFERQGYGAGD